jgi:4,5-dihydroxyphthalate decarboxylase
MSGGLEFDVAEYSSSEFVQRFANKQCPFVALPVFPSRCFRHGFIAVNRKAVRAPKDLAGKRIGVALYTQTAAVFMRGLLAEEYGVDLSGVHWVEGAINQAAPHGHPTVLPVLRPVSIAANNTGRSLSDLLAAGEIDAILGTSLPASIKTSPDVVRLFPDFREREKDYYRRTRIFPIMHTVVLRQDVHAAHPWAARSVYQAFRAAKELAVEGLYDTDALQLSLPWLLDHVEEARRVFGKDFWSYGLEPNRPTWSAIGRFVHEQGLAPRVVSPDELFAPDVE